MAARKAGEAKDKDNKLLKDLASSHAEQRDEALETLRLFLSNKSYLGKDECLRLWKGLFFSMWHCDKPRAQQQLARDLASLVDMLAAQVGLDEQRQNLMNFLNAFWSIIAREWSGIDSLRMDKYMYLIRLVHRSALLFFSSRKTDWDAFVQYSNTLKDIPLEKSGARTPHGLVYHVLDIYVDELEQANLIEEGIDHANAMCLQWMLVPVDILERQCPYKPIRKRAKDVLGDGRVSWVVTFDPAGHAELPVGTEPDEDWEGLGD